MVDLLKNIKENGVVAVIRGAKSENILSIAEALYLGGVTTLEITVETPKVLSLIESIRDKFNDKIIVGAGTVLDTETARAVIMSGAQFIFSPTVNIETIRLTKRYGVISIPGALTPTEILSAYENGADVIKVFPAHLFGPKYIKDIHAPLPHIPLMPTGGVNLENAADYIKAGGVAVGLGSNLVNTKKEISESYLHELTSSAQKFVNIVKDARD